MKKKVDIIISCFNEETNVFPFYDETIKYLNNEKYSYNLFYINDGSTDKTYEKICEIKNNNKLENVNISCISFIHNFGHESAMCAGFENSKSDYLIVMDVDLQHTPNKIPEILEKLEEGADCVLLKRIKYKSASIVKKLTSSVYYLFSKYILQNKNEKDVSDFFAVDNNLAKTVNEKYKTNLRFIRSFVQIEARNIKLVNYSNRERYSGKSRYNYFVLTKLAIISELSRFKLLRNKYKATDDNPVYIIDEKRSFYE